MHQCLLFSPLLCPYGIVIYNMKRTYLVLIHIYGTELLKFFEFPKW